MSLSPNILRSVRGAVAACALALVADRAAGEAIQFSKPTLAIVVPPKPPENLPEDRARRIDFSGPEVEAPTIMPRPPVLRPNPREEKKDDRHWLLQDPKMFSDPGRDREEASQDNAPTGMKRFAVPEPGKPLDPLAPKRPGSPATLSPEKDFNWKAHETVRRPEDSLWANRPGSLEKQSERAPGGLREDSIKSSLYHDVFNTRPKDLEKPTRGQLERRASFEALLNPNRAQAGLPARTPGSLDPVTSPEAVVTPAAAKLPGPVASKLPAKAYDPMQAFNLQHERLRGPVFEDPNKKYSSQLSAPGSSSTTVQPNPISPLMRPSGPREIPSRKF